MKKIIRIIWLAIFPKYEQRVIFCKCEKNLNEYLADGWKIKQIDTNVYGIDDCQGRIDLRKCIYAVLERRIRK